MNYSIDSLQKYGPLLVSHAKGSTNVTAYTEDKEIIWTVKVTVEDPTLPKKKKVQIGKKLDVSKLLKGTTMEVNDWSVSNMKVASINQKGVLKAKKQGKTKVTAKIDGVTRKMTVIVQ